MTSNQVHEFEKIQAQLEGLYDEISALSKKSQDGALSKFKLKFINPILAAANELLGEYKPFADFHVFDETEMPTNSDAAVMLMQYLSCMEKLRADNIREAENGEEWFWIVGKKESRIQTKPPKKIAKK